MPNIMVKNMVVYFACPKCDGILIVCPHQGIGQMSVMLDIDMSKHKRCSSCKSPLAITKIKYNVC